MKCEKYMPKSRQGRVLCCLQCGLYSLLLLAVLTPLILNKLCDLSLDQAVVIDSEDAPAYDTWQTNAYGDGADVDIHYDIYFFAIDNPEDALNGKRMSVTERGPYAFDEYYYKFDIEFSSSGDVVKYYSQKYYLFNEQRTAPGLALTDELLLPYPIFLSFDYLLRPLPVSNETQALLDVELTEMYSTAITDLKAYKAVTNCATHQAECNAINASIEDLQSLEAYSKEYVNGLENEADAMRQVYCKNGPNGMSPFWNVGPVDAYFGYLNDPVMEGFKEFLDSHGIDSNDVNTAVPGLAINYTSRADEKRINGPHTQRTGHDKSEQIGLYIHAYNMSGEQWICLNSLAYNQTECAVPGSSYIPGETFPACAPFQYEWTEEEARAHGYGYGWSNDYSNRINGTDGQSFGRPVHTPKLQMYISDIYRSLYLVNTETVNDWYDVPLRRYQIQVNDLKNSSQYEMNEQYYQNSFRGMLNLTKAAGSAVSLWATMPHFFNGDRRLVESIAGIEPRKSLHDTYLDIEPNTGLLARAHKRLQLAYRINDMNYSSIDSNAPSTWESLCKDLIDSGLNQVTAICNNFVNNQKFLTCMAEPVHWKLNYAEGLDGLYTPFAWADENLVMDEDTADGIKTGLFTIYDLENIVFIWSLILAGVILTVIVVNLTYYNANDETDDIITKPLLDDHDEILAGLQ
jgi:hypothetical protein